MDLFTACNSSSASRPLAERLRPTRLEDVVGQEHLTGPDAPLARMIAARRLGSIILWGPPGIGKTSLARLLADLVDMRFEAFSATNVTIADLKAQRAGADLCVKTALQSREVYTARTVHGTTNV